MTVQALTEHFSQLGGVTLGERRRSLNKLVQIIDQDRASACAFLDQLRPQSRLEELERVWLMLQYRFMDGLWKVYYSQDVFLTKPIFHADWFFQTAFQDIDADAFVTDVMYNLSYAKYMKTLNRLALHMNNATKLDEYYRKVKAVYGLFIAKHLLPGCSKELLLDELAQFRIIFNNRQLTTIYQRFPDVIVTYFNELSNTNLDNQSKAAHFDRYAKLVQQIAHQNPQLYWDLLQRFEFTLKLSLKSTVKIMRTFKTTILPNAAKYRSVLNDKSVGKALTLADFKLYYRSLLPKHLDNSVDFNSYSDLIKALKRRVTKNQIDFLDDVFQAAYGESLTIHEYVISEQLLEWMSAEQRAPVIAKKLEEMRTSNSQEWKWQCYYASAKAIPMIKDKIKFTSDNSNRRSLILLMITTCKVNNDYDSLQEVCAHIYSRHRNEDASMYRMMFDEICDGFKMDKFTGALWKTLNDLLEYAKLTHPDIYIHRQSDLFEGYVKYLLSNDLPIEEVILKDLKVCMRDHYALSTFDLKRQRLLLDMYPDMIVANFAGDDLNQAAKYYFNSVAYWNNRNKKPSTNIDLLQHDFVKDYITKTVAQAEYHQSSEIINNIKYFKNCEFRKQIATQVINKSSGDIYFNWMWFLKTDPQFVVDNYEKYFANKHYRDNMCSKCTLYSHIGLPQLFHAKALEILQEDPKSEVDVNKYRLAIKFLVYTPTFLQTIQPFLPDTQEITLDSSKALLEIRQAISNNLGWYRQPTEAIEAVCKMARGDYLKLSLKSVYKVAYHSPERLLENYLTTIANGPVSLRKHAMYIISKISNRANVLKCLGKIGETERNASLLKYLVNTTWAYFIDNGTEEIFQLLLQHIRLIGKDDREGINDLVKMHKMNLMPRNYFAKYMEAMWAILKSTPDCDAPINTLLGAFAKDVLYVKLSKELLDDILDYCLATTKWDGIKTQYICNLIFKSDAATDLGKRLNDVIAALSKSQTTDNTSFIDVTKSHKKMDDLICEFYTKAMWRHNNKENVSDAVQQFNELTSKLNSPIINFPNYVLQIMTDIYLKQATYDAEIFAHATYSAFIDTVSKYGPYIYKTFADQFRSIFRNIVEMENLHFDEQVLLLLKQIDLSNCNDMHKACFVLYLLPVSLKVKANIREMHLTMIRALSTIKIDALQILLHIYVKNLDLSEVE